MTATSPNGTRTLVVGVDIAPVANAGADQAAECPGPVTLDGSGSTDANSTAGTNDDIATYAWFLGDTRIAEGEVAHVNLPVGTHVITLKVTDKAGATDTDEVTVTIVDTKPPVVTLRMSPERLWPPNHKMKSVEAIFDIRDCDPAPRVQLVSVTSNEPENGLGDGDTAPDIAGAEPRNGRPQRAGPFGACRCRQRTGLHLRLSRDGRLRERDRCDRDCYRAARPGALSPVRGSMPE